MTRPEGIFLGLIIVLSTMLAGVVIFATATIMAMRLNNLGRTSIEGEMSQKRQRIVIPSLVIIGIATVLWAVLLVLDIWWNIVRGSPFERMFHAASLMTPLTRS